MKTVSKTKQYQFSIIFPILTILFVGVISVVSADYDEDWSYNWIPVRKAIKDSIQVSKFRGITSGIGSMGVSTQKEINRRRWIMETATVSELVKLTEYPNGTIKAIAYEGLLRRKTFTQKRDLTIKAIKDTTYLVDYQFGCLGTRMKIGKYLIQNVLMIDKNVPLLYEVPISNFGLSELDKEKILSEYKNL